MKSSRKESTPTVELTVESLVPGGDGLARHEGKVVFIPGVLPQERVRVALVQRKKDFDRGECLEWLVVSPDRIQPPCPVAERCGGCNWQHIQYAAQLRYKVALAQATYQRFGGFTTNDLRIESGSEFGYRNRVQVHANTQGQVGFKGRRSEDLVTVQQCVVAHPSLQALFDSPSNASRPARIQAFGHASRGKPELHREDEIQEGPVTVQVLDKTFAFALTGFFQSNLEMLERLIPFALEGLKGKLAWDLYSGAGLFAAFLQDRFEQVVAIESEPQSVAFIQRNTRPGIEVHSGKLEELVAAGVLLSSGSMAAKVPDAIVVDPPREGLHGDVRQWLLQQRVADLVYVSCDVVSQARDLKILLAGGYRLEALRLFDFYPQTHHVESVARLKWGDS